MLSHFCYLLIPSIVNTDEETETIKKKNQSSNSHLGNHTQFGLRTYRFIAFATTLNYFDMHI